jgi:hypothetical protein
VLITLTTDFGRQSQGVGMMEAGPDNGVLLPAVVVLGGVVEARQITNPRGHAPSVTAARQVQVPQSWMLPLGTLLGAGALGLIAGFAVPALGVAAATGLVLFFIGAIIAHLRVGDVHLGGAAAFLALGFLITARFLGSFDELCGLAQPRRHDLVPGPERAPEPAAPVAQHRLRPDRRVQRIQQPGDVGVDRRRPSWSRRACTTVRRNADSSRWRTSWLVARV